jgi:hypothetical protein
MATEDPNSTTDRDSETGVAGDDRGSQAREAPPAHQRSSNHVVIDGFGQGGSRTMLIVVDTLRRCGLLQVDNAGMGDTNITTTDGTVLSVGILDTDETISEEVPAAIKDEAFAELILENVIAPFVGSGGNPERVKRWFENTERLREWLTTQHTVPGDSPPDAIIMHCALLGGSGNAASSRVCQDMQDGTYLDPNNDQRGPVNIIAIAPAFRIGDRPQRKLPDQEGRPGSTFAENVIPRLADLHNHVQQDTYNALTPVSNGLLTLQSHALSAQMPYHELKRIVEPIRTSLDWSKFRNYFDSQADMTEATTINRANDALRKSVFPQYIGAINPPQLSMKLGWSRVDAADFEGLFGRGVYAPGRCFLYDTDEISNLFPKQVPAGADFQTALEGAATYSAWTNAAAFSTDSVDRATTIAYTDRDLGQTTESAVKESVASELGIRAHEVTLAQISGVTDQTFPGDEAPEIAVWSYANFTDPVSPYAQHLTQDERNKLADEHDIEVF